MHGSNRHDNSYNDPNGGFVGGFFSYPAFELFRKNDSVFSTVFGYQGAGDLNLTFRGQAELARTEYVSGDYFRGLGIPPAAGRLIVPDDDRAGAPSVAVISFALSQRRFGGPETAPGQSILINNLPFTVVGVTPPEFFGVDPDRPPDIYVPMHANLLLQDRDYSAATYLDPNVRLGCAHGAFASRRQRDAGTGGAGRPVLRMGAQREPEAPGGGRSDSGCQGGLGRPRRPAAKISRSRYISC